MLEKRLTSVVEVIVLLNTAQNNNLSKMIKTTLYKMRFLKFSLESLWLLVNINNDYLFYINKLETWLNQN